MQLMQMLPQLKGNPMQFLAQRGFQIPQGMNNPQQIVQQMLNSGRISQAQVDQARQMAMQSGMFPGGAQRR
jgi:hypothetical protein